MKGKLTDKEWVDLVRKTVDFAHKGLRLGQSYMNALYFVRPDLHDGISDTPADCFFDDDNIIILIEYLNK